MRHTRQTPSIVPILLGVVLIVALLTAWPISYWRGGVAHMRHVWHSKLATASDPAAGFREASLQLTRGQLILTLESISSTRMGLMGWGPMEPGWHADLDVFTPVNDGPAWYYNNWNYWRAGPASLEWKAGAQARARAAIPVWLPAIVVAFFTRRVWRRRFLHLRRECQLCEACAYPRGGLAQSSPCPECGATPSVQSPTRKPPEPQGPGGGT